MIYEHFCHLYLRYFTSGVWEWEKIPDFLRYLGKEQGFKDPQKFFDTFGNFDWVSLLDNIKEKYGKKLLEEKFLAKLSEENQKKILSHYNNVENELTPKVIKFLFGYPWLEHSLWNGFEKAYKTIISIEQSRYKHYMYKHYRYKLSKSLQSLIEIFKSPFYLHHLPYAFEVYKIKDLRSFLAGVLYVIKKFKLLPPSREIISLSPLIIINMVFEKWYKFLSELNEFEELTYSEYIAKTNNEEELSSRKKLLNVLLFRLFLWLFSIWFYFLLKIRPGTYHSKRWRRIYSMHITELKKYIEENKLQADIASILLIPFSYGITIKSIKIVFSNASYVKWLDLGLLEPSDEVKFQPVQEIIEKIIIYEPLTFVIKYFYDYAKYFLNLEKIKETVEKIFEDEKIHKDLIKEPERFLFFYTGDLFSYSLSAFVNILDDLPFPPSFLPSLFNINEVSNKLLRILFKKINPLVSLEQFEIKWGLIFNRETLSEVSKESKKERVFI
ncbi:MAG: plasminogen receptor (KT) [Candidatus Diapherotrites archaeon]|nr:plasminogen receptor (KT) [Candidatus Diapherotrites archaeon]